MRCSVAWLSRAQSRGSLQWTPSRAFSQLVPTSCKLFVQKDIIGVRSRMIIANPLGCPMGVHGLRRRDRADAHGDARDEQLRESKRPWSSSFDLVGGSAFDRVVRGHRRGRVEA